MAAPGLAKAPNFTIKSIIIFNSDCAITYTDNPSAKRDTFSIAIIALKSPSPGADA